MSIPIVLFVDDEPNILKTLSRLFMDEEYEVHTAGNGREALDLIEAGLRPTLIVSDQRMPVMGGAEFLARAAQLVPESIRMVLTGYADINAAVAAINQGGIYRYILKPWNDDELKMTVREAVHHFRLVEENRTLTTELEDKNRALARMNEQLEAMVQTRTLELHQKVRELEGRDRIQQYLLAVHPLEELLAQVLAVVVEICQVDGAAYYGMDAEVGRLVRAASCEAAGGNWPDETLDEAIAGLLSPVSSPTDKGLAAAEPSEQLLAHGQFVYALTPVAKGDKTFGLLVARRPPAQPFSAAERHTLASFAMQAAIGINDCHIQDHYGDIQASLDDVLADISGM